VAIDPVSVAGALTPPTDVMVSVGLLVITGADGWLTYDATAGGGLPWKVNVAVLVAASIRIRPKPPAGLAYPPSPPLTSIDPAPAMFYAMRRTAPALPAPPHAGGLLE
jgi:hypothetical protein